MSRPLQASQQWHTRHEILLDMIKHLAEGIGRNTIRQTHSPTPKNITTPNIFDASINHGETLPPRTASGHEGDWNRRSGNTLPAMLWVV